ncbi:DUF3857 domain-containing protein [Terriglobus saanensis]|uniref:Transglutaminase domain-containing protein n=1 Tax=Terriglobus saanensis (strain ATCC BAA-1853 / DSM 23119 / SP1PR4) TaxID=401053 RepID=E8V0T1_TERSS|nr:DUF3857 domain-containing protein [Terriglobus saanensis]ADV82222.1 transglutaminase domain-containing protein [Terriglobus saanensis SP1PR4]
MKMRAGWCAVWIAAVYFVPAVAKADQWTAPTPDELKMTAQPEVPGAAAVYLQREILTDDALHMYSYYVRLKVLTEEGKKYGDVQLSFLKGNEGVNTTVTDIAGRTIQSDGTIVPFTGKPFEKMVEKTKDVKVMSKVFSMPAVQVGSILEYRYKLRWDDNYYLSPDWYPQEELFSRKAHYVWKPTDKMLTSKSNGHESLSNSIAWSPILPDNAKVKDTLLPGGNQHILELSLENVKPMPQEPFMPPIANTSYRVNFYYTSYRTADEYWKGEGKYWSKEQDKFIGQGSAVSAMVHATIVPGDTSDQKLRKLYAAVMELENTDYTRQHTSAEERMAGLREIKNADDVLTRKRGSSDQLAELFVAMVRSAGMKAYVMMVTNRERRMFNPNLLSLYQLDDAIAVVNVDGKDLFLDPGTRYCPYGHLEWRHSLAAGLRQVEGGVALANTAAEPYTFASTGRVADLKLDEERVLKGKVTESFEGDPAITWRHVALRGDEASLKDDLKKHLEEELPAGMEVTVNTVENLTAYEKPLKVSFTVSGRAGTATASRLLLPGDIFLVNNKPTFTQEKRETGVYFQEAAMYRDAMRIIYPATYTLESAPAKNSWKFQQRAAYTIENKPVANSVTVYRNLTMGDFFFAPKDYAELRAFYSKFEGADQDAIVLKVGAASAPAKAGS